MIYGLKISEEAARQILRELNDCENGDTSEGHCKSIIAVIVSADVRTSVEVPKLMVKVN